MKILQKGWNRGLQKKYDLAIEIVCKFVIILKKAIAVSVEIPFKTEMLSATHQSPHLRYRYFDWGQSTK